MTRMFRNNLILTIIFLVAYGFLFWETAYEMGMDWYIDPNYSHGFLIPLISGYLIWQRKDRLRDIEVKPSKTGIFIILSGLCLFLIGKLSGEYFTMRFSMLVVLAGAILYVMGLRFFTSILFPFIYLLFMIPLPFLIYDSMAFPLKLFVSDISVGFLSSIGVLVVREGNIIHLVNTTLEVADACSGIRSIISLLALSTAMAYLTQSGWVRRLTLGVLAIPIAIFVNAIRVIGTGILAEKYGSQVAEGFFHEFAGLLIFGVAIVMLVFSAIVLKKIKKES